MIKTLILGTIVMLLTWKASAQEGISFGEMPWEEALEAAQEQEKLIFLYGFVNWSQPCAVFDKYTLSDKEVGDFYNDQFVNIRVDMEDYPGALLAEEYAANSYPVMLFVDSTGAMVHRGCGAIEADAMIALGKVAVSDSSLAVMDQRFAAGERSLEFLQSYSLALEDACMDREGMVSTYFSERPHKEWMSPTSWMMLSLNVEDIYSEPFQFLMTYHDQFSLKYGKDTVDAKIYNVMLDQMIEIYEGADLTLFATRALRQMMNEVDFQDKSELIALADLKTADLKANWPKYAANAIKVVEQQQVTDPDQLNEFAWKFYLFVEDQDQLQIASNWMKEVLDEYPDATFYDTYASLRFKLGDQKAAIKYGKKALQAAEVQLEDLMHYEQQLEMFEEGSK